MTTRRLIDANALHKAFISKQKWVVTLDDMHNEGYTSDQVHFTIDKQPTIDAVEVVRCDECKHWERWENEDFGACRNERFGDGHGYYSPPQTASDFFCKDGKRRE